MSENNDIETVAMQKDEFDRHLNMALSMIIHYEEICLLVNIIKKVVHEKIGAGQWRKT